MQEEKQEEIQEEEISLSDAILESLELETISGRECLIEYVL